MTAQIPNITRQQTVDSLFALLPETTGNDKVDVLNQLALELAPRTFDSSFQHASEAIRLSEVINYPYGKGIATFNLGNSYFFKDDIKNALTNYLEALRILESYEPSREIGDLLMQLGSINEYVRNTKKIKEYYHRAAMNYKADGDSTYQMMAYMYIGASYYYNVQAMSLIDSIPQDEANVMMDSAMKYNQIALDYFLIHHNKYAWMPRESWLSNLYNFHACYLQVKGDSLSLNYFTKAYDYAKAIIDVDGRNFLEGLMAGNLSYNYAFLYGDMEKGIVYGNHSIDLLCKTDRYDSYAMALSILGDIYLELGDLQQSEYYLQQALSISDTFLLKINMIQEAAPAFRLWGVTQLRSMRLSILTSLTNLYEQSGELDKALNYYKILDEEKKLQSRDELTRQIIGMEAEYEDGLKRQEIAMLVRDNELHRMKLNRNRILFASIGGVLLITLLLILLWIQQKRFRSEQKALVLEQKLLRAQMNPHFIFNSLYSIQNFIVTEKPDKASIYLSKFARLVRNILDNSLEEFVALEKEISTIENYLELQKVRYAGKFDYRIDIADEIDPETMKIPPMLAQPFIENAIEHGIKHRETPGHINIRFSLKLQTLIFEVEDDGVGRQKAREIEIMQDPGHRSMATSLTRERLANLNRKLNKKIFLEIIDLKNALGEAAGTKVVFGVPVK